MGHLRNSSLNEINPIISKSHKYIHLNEYMRIKVQELVLLLKQARELVPNHNLSVGYIGEEVLRSFLQANIPKRYRVTQGFVSDGSSNSPQCDIIIYDQMNYAPLYSYGSIDVIPAKSVIATIEVKTSVNKKSFCEALKRIDKLCQLRVNNNYMVIYSYIRPQTIEKYFYASQSHQTRRNGSADYDNEDIMHSTSCSYDVCDYERLPKSIVVLENGYCLQQDYVQDKYDDYYGYSAYQMIDVYNREVASLQIFMNELFNLIEKGNLIESVPPMSYNKIECRDEVNLLQYKYAFAICAV